MVVDVRINITKLRIVIVPADWPETPTIWVESVKEFALRIDLTRRRDTCEGNMAGSRVGVLFRFNHCDGVWSPVRLFAEPKNQLQVPVRLQGLSCRW
jgi:hypothetical protein